MSTNIVVSEIESTYRDEKLQFRKISKRIYESWDAENEIWILKKIEFEFQNSNFPLPVEFDKGWVVPPNWNFYGEEWKYSRRPVIKNVYDHRNDVTIIKE